VVFIYLIKAHLIMISLRRKKTIPKTVRNYLRLWRVR